MWINAHQAEFVVVTVFRVASNLVRNPRVFPIGDIWVQPRSRRIHGSSENIKWASIRQLDPFAFRTWETNSTVLTCYSWRNECNKREYSKSLVITKALYSNSRFIWGSIVVRCSAWIAIHCRFKRSSAHNEVRVLVPRVYGNLFAPPSTRTASLCSRDMLFGAGS